MLKLISWTIIPFFTYIADCYIFSKLFSDKRKLFTFKNLFLILVASIINCYFLQSYSREIRMLVMNLELIVLLKLIFNKSIVKTFIASLFILMTCAFSELICALIAVFLLNISQDVMLNNLLGQFIANIIIVMINLSMCKIKWLIKLFQKIVNWYKDNNIINTILLVIIAVATLYAVMYPISVNMDSLKSTAIFTLFCVSTIIFVIGFFNQTSRNNELSTEYDYLLDYVKIYEKELNEKSKNQHEYKNQLVIIKDLSTTKKVKDYIDKILNEEQTDKNEKLLRSLQVIPDGGIKGLIYFKLNKISYKDIEIHINIDYQLSNEKLWKICNEELNDVSKIIGVFLDNAIEALENEKEKYLIIDVEYEDNQIVFSFSNTCTKEIEYEKIEEDGYSTKGKKHGYGLSLVKDIVSTNLYLQTNKEINGKFFVQHLNIQTKKLGK